MRNVWRRMRNRLTQAVVSTCATLVPTSRPFLCAAHRSSRRRLCNSLQQLRARPTRPPFFCFRGLPVLGAFTRQITTEFSPRTVSVRECMRKVAARFAMYSCPANLLLPFFCCDDDELTSLPEPESPQNVVGRPDRNPFRVRSPPRKKPCPPKRSCDMCALCGFTFSSNGACTSRPRASLLLAISITRLAIWSAMLLIFACPKERFAFRSPSMVSPERVHCR